MSVTVVAVAISLASGATSQSGKFGQERDERPGPPHEDLGRDAERVGAVLCKSPHRDAELRKFEEEFQARKETVHREVIREFGEEVANRSYITVGPCWSFRSEKELLERLDQAKEAYRARLARWEKRYGIQQHEREE